MQSSNEKKTNLNASSTNNGELLKVIIPYRNRKDHLDQLLPRLKQCLPKPFKIVIVEQAESKRNGNLFNKGSLINAGYLESNAAMYYCFHDVDLYPNNVIYHLPKKAPIRPFSFTRGHKDYTKRITLKLLNHFIRQPSISQELHSPVYTNCFGGVVLISRDHFSSIKGFSNRFLFWGYEDLDLYERCVKKGFYPSSDPDGEFKLLPHEHVLYNRVGHKKFVLQNKMLYERKSKFGDFDDGLSGLEYRVVDKRMYEECEWISIAFD